MYKRITLDADTLDESFDATKDYLHGKRASVPSGVESLTEGISGAELMEPAVEAMSEARTAKEKILAMYAYAVARDAMYAMAGRTYLKALGHHNYFRGIYESQKMT